MKTLRCFLILMVLGLSSSAVLADGIDPKMGVIGGSGSDLWTGSFTFTIDNEVASCEGGICDFTSGAFFINEGTIFNFDFSFDTEQGPFSPLDGDPVFPIVTTIVPGFEALLSGGTIFPGDPCFEGCSPNEIFGDFRFVMDGVVEGSKVTVTSNVPVPEPGTMILLLSGFGAMGLRRLRRDRVPS